MKYQILPQDLKQVLHPSSQIRDLQQIWEHPTEMGTGS